MNWQDEVSQTQRAVDRTDVSFDESMACVPESGIDWPDPQALPSALLDVAPFDLELLPNSLRPWIADIAERLQCPADYPAVAAMVTLAGIVGRKLGIRPKRFDDWLVVPNLWGAVIGRPGLMKTPAIQEPLKALKRLEIKAKSEHDSALREYESSLIVAKATRDVRQSELKKAIKAGDGADKIAAELQSLDPSEPVRRRYLVNDCTVEKLGELLNQNPNGLTVFRDELIGFLKSLDKDGREGARAFFLEAWNGDGRFTYDRIGRGTLDIEAAIASIIGAIQPGPISEYLRKLAAGGAGDDGLLQRFQLAVWPDCPKTWRNVDRFPNSDAKRTAYTTIERLDQMQPVELAAELDEHEPVPFLRFDDGAQELFDAWREQLEPRLRSGNEHPAVESHLAKYRSLIPSLALLIHLADERDGGLVTVAALERAIGWGRYLETHARRIYGSLSQRSNGAARTLAAKILDGSLLDSFSLRDVYRPGWSGLSDRTDAVAAADVLQDHDWLNPETLDTGGAPKTVYRINPRVFTDLPGTH
jgi:putative DNA primase/helicase